MKKILVYIKIILLIFSCCLILIGCNSPEDYSVTYVYNNGETNHKIVCQNVAERPTDPIREGYVFVGWCTNEELSDFYDFSQKLESDITLYAKWNVNHVDLANEITNDIIKASVKIYTEYFSGHIAMFPIAQNQGSGIIYKKDESGYYILTNNHVIDNGKSYSKTSYTVFDAYGNAYSADFIAGDSSYDLAILHIIESTKYPLSVIEMDYEIPSIDEEVISLGAPLGQFNAVTYGAISAYKKITNENTTDNVSDISFEVIWHTAYATTGSSGGALINIKKKLIGINYAVASDENGEFLYTFSIPIEKINEFLESADKIQ